ncbi:lipopolysaccharide biosynthesis protein [Viridibacillus arvi]|uniref:lipopolysaccharide biosynthesis protein n=2 Tax=Viridibacillus arvi TaxID=263475 RepID=UPI00187B30FD|nr:oligosaccharide flippase family protein [Viridibacillus sp. JNUCC-6]QOV11116.1 oligosaccharide flippase family protein [Viridibacillus sp. JNUCC-6]
MKHERGGFMKKWLQTQIQNRFIKSLWVLIAGAAVSNIVVLIMTPILTRIYKPEDFGVLSVFTALLYLSMIIVSMRYESALMLPKEEKDALPLLCISLFSVFIVSTLVCLILLILPIATWLNIESAEPYFWILAISLLFVGIYQALNIWALRLEKYSEISYAKLAMNGGQAGSQLGFGLIKFGVIGLLIGEVLGRVIGSIYYIWKFRKDIVHSFRNNPGILWQVMKRYKNFPLISSWSGLMYSLGTHLPTLFLAAYFDVVTAGYFFLAQKLLTVPENLLGYSASQVYFTQAAQIVRVGESINQYFWETIRKLFIISALSLIIIDFAAPYLFEMIFGANWILSATFVQILSVMYLTKIVIAPLNGIFYIYEALLFQMAGECIRFGLIVLAIGISYFYAFTDIEALWCISLLTALGYIVCGVFAWIVISKSREPEMVLENG